jgi:hypothetical protein
LSVLSTLMWEREQMRVHNGICWAGYTEEEIKPIIEWMDARIDQLKKMDKEK